MVLLITAHPATAQERTIRTYAVVLRWDKKYFGILEPTAQVGPGQPTPTARAERHDRVPPTAPSAAWGALVAKKDARSIPYPSSNMAAPPPPATAGSSTEERPRRRRGDEGGTGPRQTDVASDTPPSCSNLHSEKHSREGKNWSMMQLLEIFARKQYSVCASVSAAFHMQPLRYRGERSAKAYHSHQKPKKKGAASVLEECMFVRKKKYGEVHGLRAVTIMLSKPSWRDTAVLRTS